MTSVVTRTSIDRADALRLATWWKQVLDYVDDPDDPNLSGDDTCWIQRRDAGHALLFIEVPEAKSLKNRIHLDLRPADGTREQEVDRLLDLGARLIADLRDAEGPGGWVVLGDPEGNEFCVLRPL